MLLTHPAHLLLTIRAFPFSSGKLCCWYSSGVPLW